MAQEAVWTSPPGMETLPRWASTWPGKRTVKPSGAVIFWSWTWVFSEGVFSVGTSSTVEEPSLVEEPEVAQARPIRDRVTTAANKRDREDMDATPRGVM